LYFLLNIMMTMLVHKNCLCISPNPPNKTLFPYTTLFRSRFVHQKSVFEIQDKTYVYVLNADGTVKMQPFRAGQRVSHYYIVEDRSEEHTSELQSRENLVCRLLLEKTNK